MELYGDNDSWGGPSGFSVSSDDGPSGLTKREVNALEDKHEQLQLDYGNLQEKHNRLLYIAGQLGMLKRETDSFKELWSEFSKMKYPEFEQFKEQK